MPAGGYLLSPSLGYLLTDFTDDEIEEALELIARNGGFKA